MEKHLANNIYLTTSVFNGSKLVHIRKYEKIGERKYPTKSGICLSPERFVVLVSHLDDIDSGYKYVVEKKDEWKTIHIAGDVFASFGYKFPCINIRHFFRADDNRVLPTKRGIGLTIPTWDAFKKEARALLESDAQLKSAVPCNWGINLHQNQMGFFECGECQPFYDPFDQPEMPPVYYPYLHHLGISPTKENDDCESAMTATTTTATATATTTTSPPAKKAKMHSDDPDTTPKLSLPDDEVTCNAPKLKRLKTRLIFSE
jgi:Transcriptional Coactivator p15 (PC4)